MYFGAHVSIAGGFDKCIDRIVQLGGNCLMTFASSPRTLSTRDFSHEEISEYLDKKLQNGIGPHFFHAVYLVNLATDSPDYLEASIKSLEFYQRFAGRIGAVGTIFHTGSSKSNEIPYDQITSSVTRIVRSGPPKTKLILENAAGQGYVVGSRLEDLQRIILESKFSPEHIGICLDTQHAFASGYSLDDLPEALDSLNLTDYLAVIHLNDSLVDFDSRRDRHANLGEGKIGLDKLKNFVNNPRLKQIPFILETPGEDRSGPRKQDIDLLNSLVVK